MKLFKIAQKNGRTIKLYEKRGCPRFLVEIWNGAEIETTLRIHSYSQAIDMYRGFVDGK